MIDIQGRRFVKVYHQRADGSAYYAPAPVSGPTFEIQAGPSVTPIAEVLAVVSGDGSARYV